MTIAVECEDECGWSDDVHVTDVPPLCPECGAAVVRLSEPTTPEDTLSDKV